MPKWNTENPQAKEYLLGAVAKWTRMGIDGLETGCSHRGGTPISRESFGRPFWGSIPDALIIGEFWRNSGSVASGGISTMA